MKIICKFENIFAKKQKPTSLLQCNAGHFKYRKNKSSFYFLTFGSNHHPNGMNIIENKGTDTNPGQRIMCSN